MALAFHARGAYRASESAIDLASLGNAFRESNHQSFVWEMMQIEFVQDKARR